MNGTVILLNYKFLSWDSYPEYWNTELTSLHAQCILFHENLFMAVWSHKMIIQWSLLGRSIYSGACTITLWLGKWCAADDWTLLTDNFKLKFSDVWMSSAEGTLCDTDEWEREEWHRHEHVEEFEEWPGSWGLLLTWSLSKSKESGSGRPLGRTLRMTPYLPEKCVGYWGYCFEVIAYIGHWFNRHSPFLAHKWHCHVRLCLGTHKRAEMLSNTL